LKTFENIFEFLYDWQKLKSLEDNELKECSVKFHSTFFYGDLSDVNVDDLFPELRVL
jgi:hypothetical protein